MEDSKEKSILLHGEENQSAGKDDDDSQCYECGAGYHLTYSKEIKHVKKIADVFASTSCISASGDQDDCASDGWRAMEDYLDSGNFHTGPVQVFLTLNINSTVAASFIDFEFSTHLLNGSKFKYFTSNGVAHVFDATANQRGIIRERVHLDRLDTHVTWVFQKGWNAKKSVKSRESDFVQIEQIVVHGLNADDAEGDGHGATGCPVCPAGTHSPPHSQHCRYCPAGHSSPAGAYECLMCDNESYASEKGQGACRPCGAHTYATEDRKTCTFDQCGFAHNATHEFDLSELAEDYGMLGPFYISDGKSSYSYYFNLCNKKASRAICSDYVGHYVDAYACQTNRMKYIFDPVSFGNKMGFDVWENSTNNTYGVTVTFFDGDLCVPPPPDNTTHVEKEKEEEKEVQTENKTEVDVIDKDVLYSTEVRLLCLPGSGVGQPKLKSFPEHPSCTLSFEWATEYACRLCQYSDILEERGKCAKGQQYVEYRFAEHARCAHGVVLPEDGMRKCVAIGFKIGQGIVIFLVIVGIVLAIIIAYHMCCKGRRRNRQQGSDYPYQILQ